jgi:hypothetical protein
MTQAQTAVQAIQAAIDALAPIAKQDNPSGVYASDCIGRLMGIQLGVSWGDHPDIDSHYA